MQNRKGQWLLVSAVVISTVFLVISTTFSSYFGIESSSVALRDEDFIYNNIMEKLVNITKTSPCANMKTDLDNFIAFAKQEYGKQGYLVEIEYRDEACPQEILKVSVSTDVVSVAYNK